MPYRGFFIFSDNDVTKITICVRFRKKIAFSLVPMQRIQEKQPWLPEVAPGGQARGVVGSQNISSLAAVQRNVQGLVGSHAKERIQFPGSFFCELCKKCGEGVMCSTNEHPHNLLFCICGSPDRKFPFLDELLMLRMALECPLDAPH